MKTEMKRSGGNKVLFLGGCLAGLLCFLTVYGWAVLDVTYDSWIFYGDMDLTQHYLGWCHYRTTPWQFPVGLIDSLSAPISVSVLWTDSMPVLAVLFKLLSPVLPETFQYFGWFALVSFMLQGGMAALLIGRWSKSRLVCFSAATFFVLSFPMLQRTFYHTSLSAQWILLLALYLQLERERMTLRRKCLAWAGMGVLCVGIHSYFLPMAAIFLAGSLVQDLLSKKSIRNVLAVGASYCAPALVCLYVLGAFYEGADATGPGLGTFCSNLNTFFNSQGHSAFLPAMPLYFDFQYEGFGYLGLGMLVLCALAAVILLAAWLKKRPASLKVWGREHISALVLLAEAALFLVLAVFPIITLGDRELLHVPYPALVEKLLSIFRSNGRFIWGAVYLIMLGAIYVSVRFLREDLHIIVICMCVGLQFLDSADYMNEKREYFYQSDRTYATVWEKAGLEEALAGYRQFVFLYNENDIIMDTAYFTYRHGMSQNNYYYARSYDEEIEQAMNGHIRALKQGAADEDTVYVLKREQTELIRELPLYFYPLDADHLAATNRPLPGVKAE